MTNTPAVKPPPSDSSPRKRSSDDCKDESHTNKVANSNTSKEDQTQATKRPKVVSSDGANEKEQPVVSPTESAASSAPSDSREQGSRSAPESEAASAAASATDEEVLDLAETLGLKPGAQIEVQWEIHTDASDPDEPGAEAEVEADGEHNDDDDKDEQEPTVTLHWWKATLQEHDGRTTDSVAVRTLLYEARPDLGFPDPSSEDVVFLGPDVLAASTDPDSADWEQNPENVRRMPYRRVDPDHEVVRYNDDQLDDQLNDLLMGAVRKNQAAWRALPAATQASIAEKIRHKKEQLKSVLQAQKHKVITSETIRDILAQTF
eukprot:jgi/Psemu1/198459/e_gw1.219.6.1